MRPLSGAKMETSQAAIHHIVWINGRFLSRKVTGVERVAHEILRALSDCFLDEHASCDHNGVRLSFKIVAPVASKAAFSGLLGHIPIHTTGAFSGHLWEQLVLSKWARSDWLLNLCNTAPLWRRRQSTFIHDAQVFAIPRNFNWKFGLWYRTMLRIVGKRSEGVFTNSQFSQTELSKFAGISDGKIAVLHLGADHMHRLAPSMTEEVSTQIPKRPFLLAVSSASPNKNFEAIVRAISILGDDAPPCVFVGQKNSAVFGKLDMDTSRITELGYVSDETLAVLYSRALCLVYPSYYEGFGLPPLEAMALGTPVIVSNTSSLPEVCADAALYCDPSKPETLAQAIRVLQTDQNARQVLSLAGKERAKAFAWNQCVEKMLDALCVTLKSQK